MGFRMKKCSSTFSMTSIAKEHRAQRYHEGHQRLVGAIEGVLIGTETTCAPITSFNCQPKPLALP